MTLLRAAAAGLVLTLVCGLALPGPAQAQRLMDFYRQALDSNPTLRASERGVDQAQAQQELARSKLRPQVSATAGYTWNDSRESGLAPRHYNSVRAGLQAQQALVDLAATFKLQGARFAVLQSEQLRQAERLSLAGEVVDRYLTVLQAADELGSLQAEKKAIDAQRQRLRFMRERQLAKVTDLVEVEAYFQGLLTREIEAHHLHLVALARLQEISGLAAQGVPPLAREAFAGVPGTAQEWAEQASRDNPQLGALRQAIEAAQMDIRSGRAEALPRLALTVSQTHSGLGYDNRQVPTYTVGSIGLQATIPIYEGGRVQAEVSDAVARFEMAREKLEGARREIERDVHTAHLNAATHHARIASTGDEVEALVRLVDAQTKGYELGVSTVVDVLNAQRRLAKSRSDRQRARYDFIRAMTQLRVRAGRLVDTDVQEIDGWMAEGRAGL